MGRVSGGTCKLSLRRSLKIRATPTTGLLRSVHRWTNAFRWYCQPPYQVLESGRLVFFE